MKRVFYLLLIAILVFSMTKGYSQEFRVINGTISLTNAAGVALGTKIIRGNKVIVNYQPHHDAFELDSVLFDTTGTGFVVLSKTLYPSSLAINSLQTNSRVRIVFKQKPGLVINSERHYIKNGVDSMVRDSTPMVKQTTLTLPIDFQLVPDSIYKFTNFDGGAVTVVANPSATGINTSTKVGKMVKGPGGQTWGGSWIALTNPIDFTNKNRFYMQVYSNKVGAKVLLKVENITNGDIYFEASDTTTTANSWELLEFDYSLINKAHSYQKIVLIFDNGTVGDGSANFTYYFDNISLGYVAPVTPAFTLALPIDFQSVDSNYKFTNFDGGVASIVANPSATGINTSTKVAKMVKGPGGQTWGGSWIALTNPIDFTNKNRFYMQVYSNKVGAKVLLKVENLTDGGIYFEASDTTTTSNSWELLEFDYSLINKANSYQKIVLIFDNGTVGNGSDSFTYYFDNISLGNVAPTTTLALPIDFQLADSTYKFTDFEGGHATVVPNPLTTGINTSTKCGQMVKGPGGATYGGSYLTLTNPIPLTSKRFSINILADSGTSLVFKLENGSNGNDFFQRDAIVPVGTKQWRTFTFDFTVAQASSTVDSYQFGMGKYNVIDSTKTYQKVVLVFNNGTVGDGTANFTFYFDDIQQLP